MNATQAPLANAVTALGSAHDILAAQVMDRIDQSLAIFAAIRALATDETASASILRLAEVGANLSDMAAEDLTSTLEAIGQARLAGRAALKQWCES